MNGELSRIRVLHVVPNMQQGGIENYIMNMYKNIDRSKVQFDFLEHYSEDFFFDEEIRNMGGRIYRIPYMESKRNINQYINDLNSFFCQHAEFSTVHGHMATTALFYLAAAERAGIKNRIIHAHEDSYLKTPRGALRMMLIKQAWRHASLLLACSESSGHYYFGNRTFQIRANAIDTTKFTFDYTKREKLRSTLDIGEGTFVLGHIGRFSQQKNHAFLIQILREVVRTVPNTVLIMVGKGETQSRIRSLVRKLDLTRNVRFINPTNSPEKFYAAMDVFVLPSFYEGLPLTGVEAQCNGLQCLFSDTVTSEVSLIDGASHFMSLRTGAEAWARKIAELNNSSTPARHDASVMIGCKGYDARLNAHLMQSFYQKLDS